MRNLGVATLLALSVLGCGGKSSSSGDDGSGSSGGSAAKPRDCELGGNTYKNGSSFEAPDGCNSCSCVDGEVSCTLLGCNADSCAYDGETYNVGDEFTTADGSVCVCESTGAVECTVSSDECAGLGTSYQALLERAKACDPRAAANECTLLVDSALTCGCVTFVNPNAFSKGAVAAVEQEFAANGCEQKARCAPGPSCDMPARGYCAPNGQCADLRDFGDQRACKVAGVIYPSGSAGIQDPFSCNQCVCQDGTLACDDAACPKPCPENTKPGKSCAECGPIDNCLILEYDCMPACVDTCAQGACMNGVCVTFCG